MAGKETAQNKTLIWNYREGGEIFESHYRNELEFKKHYQEGRRKAIVDRTKL